MTRAEKSELAEASMNFDAEGVGPFLARLSSLAGGFGPTQIEQVVCLVDRLGMDEERELRFEVTHEGRSVPLLIKIFKDDVSAPDLYFFTTPRLAEAIDRLMKDFCDEHGL
jgi:hypothetical protein